MDKTSILIHGPIGNWTKKIVNEYTEKYSNSEIFWATWEIPSDGFSGKFIKTKPPGSSDSYYLDVNSQKNSVLSGLEKIQDEIVMICRTDQFVQNQNIFQIYEDYCPKNLIMISNYLTIREIDYLASYSVQIANLSILKKFWNSIPDFDNSFPIQPEIYFTSNYLLREKHDMRPWKTCLTDHFFVLDFKKDFKIEWEQSNEGLENREHFEQLYQKCVKSEM